MLFASIIFLNILIPSMQSGVPSLQLTFTPNERYFTMGHSVEILCESLNPTDQMEAPQLWHIEYKTGKHTPISRLLLLEPPIDAPDVFKRNQMDRIKYIKKNHILIQHLQLEDSGEYACNCPDCAQRLQEDRKHLQVMRLIKPEWHIEPGYPIQEHAKTTIKCTVDDFYPYVSHRIVRHHHEITRDGKSNKPDSNAFPHKFSWEAVVTPTADWHNTSLQCTVLQGNTEEHAIKLLEVLFTPRFLTCDEKQYVNSSQEQETIECSYSGNPAPQLTWLRETDQKPITSDLGITVEVRDDHHGKYTSIVTFDRNKLISIPTTTTTKTTTIKTSSEKQGPTKTKKGMGENYYQQLLEGGFIAKLLLNGEERGTKIVSIASDVSEVRSNSINNSSTILAIKNLSTSIILFSLLSILFMRQHY